MRAADLLPRNNVYLDEEIKQEYRTATVSMVPSCIDFGKMKQLFLVCYHCGSRNLSCGDIYFYRCPSFRHFYCHCCFNYNLEKFNHTCVDGERIHGETMVEYSLCGRLKFECLWNNCNKIFGGATLKRHELSCDFQPLRECPVEGCSWSGKLDSMKGTHLYEHKNQRLIFGNVIQETELGLTYFLLILNRFVRVNYDYHELGEVFEHKVELKAVGDKHFCPGPVGMVSASRKLLKKIQGTGTVKSLRRSITLFVYFG